MFGLARSPVSNMNASRAQILLSKVSLLPMKSDAVCLRMQRGDRNRLSANTQSGNLESCHNVSAWFGECFLSVIQVLRITHCCNEN